MKNGETFEDLLKYCGILNLMRGQNNPNQKRFDENKTNLIDYNLDSVRLPLAKFLVKQMMLLAFCSIQKK